MHPEAHTEGSEKGKHRAGLFLSVPPDPALNPGPAVSAAEDKVLGSPSWLWGCCIFPRAEQDLGLGLRVLEIEVWL